MLWVTTLWETHVVEGNIRIGRRQERREQTSGLSRYFPVDAVEDVAMMCSWSERKQEG